jgi:hypothetical protein
MRVHFFLNKGHCVLLGLFCNAAALVMCHDSQVSLFTMSLFLLFIRSLFLCLVGLLSFYLVGLFSFFLVGLSSVVGLFSFYIRTLLQRVPTGSCALCPLSRHLYIYIHMSIHMSSNAPNMCVCVCVYIYIYIVRVRTRSIVLLKILKKTHAKKIHPVQDRTVSLTTTRLRCKKKKHTQVKIEHSILYYNAFALCALTESPRIRVHNTMILGDHVWGRCDVYTYKHASINV